MMGIYINILSLLLLFLLLPLRCPLQASELGMTSAFYKYILTTMVGASLSITGSQHPSC